MAIAINSTIQSIRLHFNNGPVGQFFRWWRKELGSAMPAKFRARLQYAHRQLLMHVSGSGTGDGAVALSIADHASAQLLDTIASSEDVQLQCQRVQELLQQHELTEVNRVLLLDETDVLRTEVVMPLAAEANLGQALVYEMDRHTPFQAEDVFFDWRVLERDRDTCQLTFELFVVPRGAVEADIALLKRMGLAPTGADVVAEQGSVGVNLLPPSLRYRVINKRVRANWILVAVTAMLLVMVMAQSLWLRKHQLLEINEAIEEVRAEAMAVQQIRKQIDDASEAADFMQSHKIQNGYKLEMMAELTRILPQDTYLDRLTLHADTVQMQGKSDNAQALIELVNDSPVFENASFRGPTRLDTRSHKEIFDLNADITRKDMG